MRKHLIVLLMMLMLSCLLAGCHGYLGEKQDRWHDRVLRGATAVALVARGRAPLLSEEQVLALIRDEPDLKVTPIELGALVQDDDPSKVRTMDDIWRCYFRARRDAGRVERTKEMGRWQDSDQFKRSTLWVYEESYHFDKPLHQGEWLHCLFCAEPTFVAHVFFIENGEFSGATDLGHDLPLAHR
jgi:hypothetical protein